MKYLNKSSVAALFLSGSLLLTSCEAVQNANNTQKGAAIGTAGGAVLGGILGNNIGRGGNGAIGAVLGGILGGVAGGVIGNKMDKQAREINQALPGAEVERVGEGIKVILNENTINFNFDSATLTPTAKANLDKLIPVFKNNPDTNINVYGHTDAKGTDSYNIGLSERRANSVISYFVANGLSRGRFVAKGMGKAEPIATNDTEAGRAQNRRVEFAITANEKMIQDAKQGK
ncbi:OmpA family protein [Elizabethkingia anophelis]|uniref:OmpA family protein n=1 Tax=Elizabethkingia anophelis R26 TaxID=1246994 RepID=A0ABN5C2E9_9FLAO|nr:OmpA family protein [Elizabethkingia anophelis]ATC38111.1 OmpA family protein [Elizabethkingia anophelis R26]ATC41790.1 OmpA family protein [Elizabethkingia anophelis Ag1]ATC45468.1 OmpA family protein [Elizabethkingia anophelis]ATC49144.1 OmpA family protein [Elizabethkingia anophelis]ELR78201.1 OmpA/MotB domain protein [Elizabethkingia anophelis R26]